MLFLPYLLLLIAFLSSSHPPSTVKGGASRPFYWGCRMAPSIVRHRPPFPATDLSRPFHWGPIYPYRSYAIDPTVFRNGPLAPVLLGAHISLSLVRHRPPWKEKTRVIVAYAASFRRESSPFDCAFLVNFQAAKAPPPASNYSKYIQSRDAIHETLSAPYVKTRRTALLLP